MENLIFLLLDNPALAERSRDAILRSMLEIARILNEEVNMVAEFVRDYEMIGDSRGLCFAMAGSIDNGSRLTGMRLIMAAIQRHGRYA